MKKIFVFCFVFVLGCSVASAKTYYSEYGIWQESLSPILPTDTRLVERDFLYKWYKFERDQKMYYREGENDEQYPYIDKDDFLVTDWTEWSFDIMQLPNRVIEQKPVYVNIRDVQSIQYIHLYNFSGKLQTVKLSEFQVYLYGEKFYPGIMCETCHTSVDFLDDGDVATYLEIPVNGHIILNLHAYYNIENISFKVISDSVQQFTIAYGYYANLDSKVFAYQDVDLSLLSCGDSFCTLDSNSVTLHEINLKGGATISDIPTTYYNKLAHLYRYKDVYYQYYSVRRQYDDSYRKESIGEYIYKDEQQFQELFRFKEREKCVIQDIVFTNHEQRLEDFVEYCSTPYEVHTTVDNHKNGIYMAEFLLPYQTIKLPVTVAIYENDSSLQEKIIHQNQELIEKQEVIEKLERELTDSSLIYQGILLEQEKQSLLSIIQSQKEEIDGLLFQVKNTPLQELQRILGVTNDISLLEKFQYLVQENEYLKSLVDTQEKEISGYLNRWNRLEIIYRNNNHYSNQNELATFILDICKRYFSIKTIKYVIFFFVLFVFLAFIHYVEKKSIQK